MFLTSCWDLGTAAKDKLSRNEVDISHESTMKKKAGCCAALMKGDKAKKKTDGRKDNSKVSTKESKSDCAAPTKGGK